MIYNGELEQSILACLIIDDDLAQEVYNLRLDDFQLEHHKIILTAIKDLVNQKQKVDYLTLYDRLNQNIELSYLLSLANSLPGASGYKSYVKQLKDLTQRRQLRQLADTLGKMAIDGDEDAVNYAEKTIFQIREREVDEEFTTPKDLVLSVMEDIEERVQSNKELSGIDTGFTDINRMTDGLQDTDLIILAARPSMGKTSLAVNIAQNVACKGNTVAIYSLEMSKKQLIKRMLLSEAFVSDLKIRMKAVKDKDWQRLTKASSHLYQQNIHISDEAGLTVSKMLSMSRKLKRKAGKLDLVIIDYLQLISSEGIGRMEQITNISNALKGMAKELNCPVMVLSQLSRACEQRQNKRPQLSDLRESGAIEQDADVVMFLYRDEYYNPETKDKAIAEVIFGKQRNGPTGTMKLGYILEITTFMDLMKLERMKGNE